MRERRPHGGHGALAGVDASHVPEKDSPFALLARVQHVVESGRELQERRRGCPAVLRCDVVGALWPGLLRQDGVCLARVHDPHRHVQRATIHAGGRL